MAALAVIGREGRRSSGLVAGRKDVPSRLKELAVRDGL